MVKLKYVILYVTDLDKTLAFYEQAFALSQKMRQGEYAEVSTGPVTLAFAEREFVASHTGMKIPKTGGGTSEIALVVPGPEVAAQFAKAVSAGAAAVVEPKTQPWGQIVSYVRDPDGHLIEICSPAD